MIDEPSNWNLDWTNTQDCFVLSKSDSSLMNVFDERSYLMNDDSCSSTEPIICFDNYTGQDGRVANVFLSNSAMCLVTGPSTEGHEGQ